MDSDKFDKMAKVLSNDTTRRGVLGGLAGILASVVGVSSAEAGKRAKGGKGGKPGNGGDDCSKHKVPVCHKTGHGKYKLKYVNKCSLDAHLGHGDYEYKSGGCCSDKDCASNEYCKDKYCKPKQHTCAKPGEYCKHKSCCYSDKYTCNPKTYKCEPKQQPEICEEGGDACAPTTTCNKSGASNTCWCVTTKHGDGACVEQNTEYCTEGTPCSLDPKDASYDCGEDEVCVPTPCCKSIGKKAEAICMPKCKKPVS